MKIINVMMCISMAIQIILTIHRIETNEPSPLVSLSPYFTNTNLLFLWIFSFAGNLVDFVRRVMEPK